MKHLSLKNKFTISAITHPFELSALRREEYLDKYDASYYDLFSLKENKYFKTNLKQLLFSQVNDINNYKLKYNLIFSFIRKEKMNKSWKFAFKAKVIHQLFKRLYYIYELYKVISIYIKLWLEDRILYEYYIYKYIKKKGFFNKLLTTKLILNYFKYKKLLYKIKRKLNKISIAFRRKFFYKSRNKIDNRLVYNIENKKNIDIENRIVKTLNPFQIVY